MSPKTFLTSEEAAEALGVAEQTLASWRRTGQHDLRYYKLGRLIRYDAADIEDLLETAEITDPDIDSENDEVEDMENPADDSDEDDDLDEADDDEE